jgi:hypothetical protein
MRLEYHKALLSYPSEKGALWAIIAATTPEKGVDEDVISCHACAAP